MPLFFLSAPRCLEESVKSCVAFKFWVSETYTNPSSLLAVAHTWTLTTQCELTSNCGSRASVQFSYCFYFCCEMILRLQKFSRWEVIWFLLGSILCRDCCKVLPNIKYKNPDSLRVLYWEAKPTYLMSQMKPQNECPPCSYSLLEQSWPFQFLFTEPLACCSSYHSPW